MPRSCYTCLLGLLLAAQVSGQFGGVPTPIPCTGCPLPLVVDFDGANGPDLLFADGTSLRWMANDGNGVFTDPVELAQNPDSMISNLAQDVDGDADIDVVGITTTFDGTSIWLMRNDGADFTPVLIDTIDSTFRAPDSVVDLDGDGDLDLLGVDHPSGELWYRNNGDGTYGQEVIGRWCTEGVKGPYTPLDIDNDGDLDLVGFANPLGRLIVHWNLGKGKFGPFTVASDYLGQSTIGLALDTLDRDDDGFTDLIAGAVVLISSGYGTFFREPNNTYSPITMEFQSVGNVDCDDALEAVMSSNVVPGVFSRDLNSGITYVLDITETVRSTLSDLNGDGRSELITRTTSDISPLIWTNTVVPLVVSLDLPDTLFLSEPLVLTGGEPANSFGVYIGEGVFAGTLYPASVGTGFTVITYSQFNINDISGCSNGYATDTVYIANLTSIGEQPDRKLVVYPNPVEDVLSFLTTAQGPMDLIVRDLMGRTIKQERVASADGRGPVTLPVGELANGCYQLTVSRSGAPEISTTFVIAH